MTEQLKIRLELLAHHQRALRFFPLSSEVQEELFKAGIGNEEEGGESSSLVPIRGFVSDGGRHSFESGMGIGDATVEGISGSSHSSSNEGGDGDDKIVDRAINAAIVLAAGTFAITMLLMIDHDYWQGWTLYEIIRYVPQHNWTAYEEALKTNPVLAKMMISGVVYSIGDWIAQSQYLNLTVLECSDLALLDFHFMALSRITTTTSVSFLQALFPFQDWWVVPAKVAFDQTAWSAVWNSIYFVVLGFLLLESPGNIFFELKARFWPMLTAGWKLCPFAHLVTYGVIPVEHKRFLWVDTVELI